MWKYFCNVLSLFLLTGIAYGQAETLGTDIFNRSPGPHPGGSPPPPAQRLVSKFLFGNSRPDGRFRAKVTHTGSRSW